jgi:predicted lipoprotein with Yx(FWY)xxD motif
MRPTLKTLLPALAASLTLAACGSSSSSTSSQTTASTATSSAASASPTGGAVKTASNSTLRATALVDAQGFTVYHLSGEQGGKFICTSAACEAQWHPVSASAVSASVGGLTTVKRPDGAAQLAYKGTPLYTFAGDKAPGDANGQGIKDVGTWTAITMGAANPSSSSTGSQPAPSAPASSAGESSGGGSSGGGGGYGY